MCKMYRLSSVCYQHLRSSGADVRALMVQGVAVTMVPKGRNVHEEVGDGTTTFTVKFVGAGACTVPGIAGSGAGIGSVVGRRYYSTGVNNSKKEVKIEPAKNIEDVDEKLNFDNMTKSDVIRAYGKLEEKLVAKDLLLKRVSVAYYLRTRMDRLQWTLTEDIDVRNELNHANVKVIIPPDISPDGQTSYRSRYRIWHAIMIVMQTKKNGFVAEVKAVFDTVGLPWQDPEMMASIFAKLFNHLSAEVKNNEFDIDVEWENEEELLEICAKRSVQDPKELCAVKAIYRLKP